MSEHSVYDAPFRRYGYVPGLINPKTGLPKLHVFPPSGSTSYCGMITMEERPGLVIVPLLEIPDVRATSCLSCFSGIAQDSRGRPINHLKQLSSRK